MEEKEFKIDLEIAQEIRRLKELYQHYKVLYRRVRFLCCSEQKETVKHNRDHYKVKLKEMVKLQCERV